MRWPLKILKGKANPNPEKPKPKPNPGTTPSGIHAKLYAYYSKYSNYQKVTRDVMSWYGTRSNGCVAFMTTALRHVGLAVPKRNDSRGENISLVTRPFSNYLEYELGWTRITDDRQMKKATSSLQRMLEAGLATLLIHTCLQAGKTMTNPLGL